MTQCHPNCRANSCPEGDSYTCIQRTAFHNCLLISVRLRDIMVPMRTPIAIPIASHAPPEPSATEIAMPIPAPSAIPNPTCTDGRFICLLPFLPSLRDSVIHQLTQGLGPGLTYVAPSGLVRHAHSRGESSNLLVLPRYCQRFNVAISHPPIMPTRIPKGSQDRPAKATATPPATPAPKRVPRAMFKSGRFILCPRG